MVLYLMKNKKKVRPSRKDFSLFSDAKFSLFVSKTNVHPRALQTFFASLLFFFFCLFVETTTAP